MFEPVMKKELAEQFSSKMVKETIHELEKNYKSQASGRNINLFYLKDDKRERIELETNDNQPVYRIHNTNIAFSREEILQELHEHPDRFSPNVILRGVMQELILPNVAFIGGGGELAYWLELKKVFEAAKIPYPVLILRNSFLIVEKKYVEMMTRLNLKTADLFLPENDMFKKIITERTGNKTKLNGELEKVEGLYNQIMSIASNVDVTLTDHVASLKTKAIYRLQELEKKLLRAEKRKYQDELHQVIKIKEALFPVGRLQERVENISTYYGRYGRNLLNALLDNSLTLEQQFAILQILS
jgi:bacillithiol biosynthesis cysteine-adding enzyme BshC